MEISVANYETQTTIFTLYFESDHSYIRWFSSVTVQYIKWSL